MSTDPAPIHHLQGAITCVTVPAQLRYLEIVRPAVRIAMDGYGADPACATDIGLAVDELASVLIACAGSAGELQVVVAQDPTDVHIELTIADVATRSEPNLDALSRQLLEATTAAHSARRADRTLTGRLRRRLTDHACRSAACRDVGARPGSGGPSGHR